MPEAPNPKLREAPPPTLKRVAFSPHAYAELDVKTNFTFLCGASHPDELVYRAAELGYRAIGVTDINSLAGVVRMHEAAKEVGLPLLVGSRLVFTDAPDLLVWASDRESYAALCRLLTLGKRRAEKGQCTLHLEDFLNDNQGLHAAIVAPADVASLCEAGERWAVPTLYERAHLCRVGTAHRFLHITAHRDFTPLESLHEALGDRLSLAVSCGYGPDDAARLAAVNQLSERFGVPMLATNAVHYHDPSRRALQDVLTCVKHGCTISQAGFRLFPNGERYLKPPEQMHRLFADYPQALRRGLHIADACQFQLDSLRYEYPDELAPTGISSLQHLKELTEAGLAERYPQGVHPRVRAQIEHELKLIEQLKFEAYFLTVYDLVRFARSRGILCQGRGSAANSAVCYAIGVTSVDPARVDLLFERFISAARNEPPDIDIDFEHERREEVIQYIYTKYGRERAGMTAEVITYRGRSAVRDVGKAMGLSLDMVDSMAAKLDWWDRGLLSDEQIRACGLDPDDANVRRVIALATELLGFPRHLSQHVGGLVMTRGPLCEMVPIENASMADRTVIEWDKDDIDSLGILKVDALALGMLTAISRAFGLINDYQQTPSVSRFEQIPALSMPSEELSLSPGTAGDLRGEGLANCLQSSDSQTAPTPTLPSSSLSLRAEGRSTGGGDKGDPHPNPLPEYRERGQDQKRWAVPTLHEGAAVCRVGTAHRLFDVSADEGLIRAATVRERGTPVIEGFCKPPLPDGRGSDQCSTADAALVARAAQRSPLPDGRGSDQCSTADAALVARAAQRSPLPDGRGSESASTADALQQAGTFSSVPLPDGRGSESAPGRLALHNIPPADEQVYDMICEADTVGVFQIESRAQMSMLPRLRPRCFYDLVIEVAIVRPGPIQGNMVHPYLRRRSGDEPVSFPSEELRHVLEKTLGVPLFQEQAMRIAMVAAGFTADEADKLRRVMAAWRRSGAIETFHRKIVEGMVGNGYTREFAEQCFNQIKGFGEYGFPESHAASFALLVYVSAWIKRHHPAAFAAALINSQPMGFYMPAQIVRDAQDHGVRVLPADVNESDWDCTLEAGEGLRAGEKDGGQCPPYVDDESLGRVPRLDTPSRGRCEQSNASPSSDRTVAPSACRVGIAHHLADRPTLPKSEWGAHGPQLRLGLRQLKGFKEAYARQIETERKRNGRFISIEQLQQRAGLPTSALRILAEADAFGSLGLSRRQALWQVMELKDVATPLFDRDIKNEVDVRSCLAATRSGARPTRVNEQMVLESATHPDALHFVSRLSSCEDASGITQPSSPDPALPIMPLGQEVMTDYATAGLSLKKHPVALIRDQLRAKRIVTSKELDELPDGRWVKVAGLVLMRQRPGTASGIVFETLEDETGIVNLIVKPDVYDRFRPAARHAGLLQADGYLQRQGDVVHVIPKRMIDLSDMIAGYELRSRDFH